MTTPTPSSPSTSAPLASELFGLRFQHATGELDNTAALSRAKREIARALTVAREREIDAES